ncbi:hypothetical protein SBI67_24940 [Mycolicibacterium sp. 120266]|nr:hypothetical protein [Mycolicibacterium sp. 120266]MDX1875379.1 hypothetical protein [Mycolicibacterium sp. 120266]
MSAAIVCAAGIAAGCSTSTTERPSTSTTTVTPTSTHITPAPTEKSISPTGGNRFTPPVLAPPAPNVPPGQHPGINGIT